MRGILGASLFAAVLAIACAAQAQAPPKKGAVNPSTTVGEIVVQGQKSPIAAEHLPAVVWKDVKVRAQPSHTGSLSRWMKAVCPGVFGLTPPYARFVAERITKVTRDVAPARPACQRGINLMVVFTTTPQEVMDDVREHHPMLLGYHYLIEEKKLATFQGPMEAWYVTATNNFMDHAYGPGMRVGNAPTGASSGRLRNGQNSSVVFVLVVVDAKAIENQPIGPLSDHIAAMALSKSGPRKGCSPLPSILDALDPACPDSASLQTLSDYDRAFLKALYASLPDEVGQAERGSVMLGVLRDLKASPQTSGGASAGPKPGAASPEAAPAAPPGR